jgi:hypothetical protein
MDTSTPPSASIAAVRPLYRRIGAILSILLLIPVLAWIVGMFFLKPLLGDRLVRVAEKEAGYRLEIGSMRYNLLTGAGMLSGLKIRADSATRGAFVVGTIAQIDIRSIHLLVWWKTNQIRIDEILVIRPDFAYRPARESTSGSSEGVEWSVGSVQCREGRFKVLDSTGTAVAAIGRITFQVDSLQHQARADGLPGRLVSLQADSLWTGDQWSDYRLASLSFEDGRLEMNTASIQPRNKRFEHVRKSGGNTYTAVSAARIQAEGVQLSDTAVRVRSLRVDEGDVTAFEVRNRSAKTSGPRNPFPMQQFSKLPFFISCDTISVAGINVRYDEFNPDTRKTGGVSFRGIRGTITGLSNDSTVLKNRPWCLAHFDTRFMGRYPLRVDFRFRQGSASGRYECRADLGPVDLPSMNPVFQPLAKISIESGRVNHLRFQFSGDDHTSSGTASFLYQDLSVKILKHDEEKGFRIRDLLSFTANRLLVYKHNPMPRKEVRTGAIRYTRIPGESFWGILWRSIRSGLWSSVKRT